MARDNFDTRIRELDALLPRRITGKLIVDQVYALAIHSGYWRTGPLAGVTNHPRHGGETHFLTNGLTRNRERYLRNLAHRALEPGGLEASMIENVEDLSRYVHDHAPREEGALRNSGHPIVTVGHTVVYDRPPLVHRLSREELKHRHDFVPKRHFGRR